MSAGSVWWGQIGNSIRFLTKISDNLQDCRSAILQIPRNLPWRQDFYEAIDIRRTTFSDERRMVRLVWKEEKDPGRFVLDELCSAKVRADYWPGQTYAEYLGAKSDLLMNDYYVWIRGIRQKSDLTKWIEFVSQYQKAAKDEYNSAVFILEYDGENVDGYGIDIITYTIERYDCRVFSLESATSLGNTELRDYQAELALSISDNNPELCDALLNAGTELLLNPVQTAMDIASHRYSSEGVSFPELDEQRIQSLAWEAAVVLFFPILEHYRMNFISKFEAELVKHLPISNSNGDRITDPYDLEIGSLQYIVATAERDFPAMESDNIRLCRKARNLLAHNKPLPYSDILKIVLLSLNEQIQK